MDVGMKLTGEAWQPNNRHWQQAEAEIALQFATEPWIGNAACFRWSPAPDWSHSRGAAIVQELVRYPRGNVSVDLLPVWWSSRG